MSPWRRHLQERVRRGDLRPGRVRASTRTPLAVGRPGEKSLTRGPGGRGYVGTVTRPARKTAGGSPPHAAGSSRTAVLSPTVPTSGAERHTPNTTELDQGPQQTRDALGWPARATLPRPARPRVQVRRHRLGTTPAGHVDFSWRPTGTSPGPAGSPSRRVAAWLRQITAGAVQRLAYLRTQGQAGRSRNKSAPGVDRSSQAFDRRLGRPRPTPSKLAVGGCERRCSWPTPSASLPGSLPRVLRTWRAVRRGGLGIGPAPRNSGPKSCGCGPWPGCGRGEWRNG